MKIRSIIPFVTLVSLILILFVPESLLAQGPPPPAAAPDLTPIDGGLALLAAAGGAYAMKKLTGKKE